MRNSFERFEDNLRLRGCFVGLSKEEEPITPIYKGQRIIVKRNAATGDVLMTLPIIKELAKNNTVSLMTIPELFNKKWSNK